MHICMQGVDGVNPLAYACIWESPDNVMHASEMGGGSEPVIITDLSMFHFIFDLSSLDFSAHQIITTRRGVTCMPCYF